VVQRFIVSGANQGFMIAFYDILVEIDNNLIEPNSAKQTWTQIKASDKKQ
jgi:hypothetical protein